MKKDIYFTIKNIKEAHEEITTLKRKLKTLDKTQNNKVKCKVTKPYTKTNYGEKTVYKAIVSINNNKYISDRNILINAIETKTQHLNYMEKLLNKQTNFYYSNNQ